MVKKLFSLMGVLVLSGMVLGSPLFAADPTELTIATENADTYPWGMADGTGIDFAHVKLVAKNLGIQVKFVTYPWKRCLETLKANDVDAVFSGSFKKKRQEMGVYPMKGDTYDESKCLHSSSYSLYVLKDSKLSWDGNGFVGGLEGKIGCPAGYSIIEKVKGAGAEVHEVKTTAQLMQMLVAGRIQGVVTLTPQGDFELSKNADFESKIKKEEKPLVKKPYFLLFSHKMVKENPEFCKKFWDEIEKVRESDEYKKASEDFLNK